MRRDDISLGCDVRKRNALNARLRARSRLQHVVDRREESGEIHPGLGVGPRIHVLPQQGHLTVATQSKAPNLVHNRVCRTIDLQAAGARNDAEGAIVVASLHDGYEGANAVCAVGFWSFELNLVLGIDLWAEASLYPTENAAQAMNGTRTDDEVHAGLAIDDLPATLLRDAAGNPH